MVAGNDDTDDAEEENPFTRGMKEDHEPRKFVNPFSDIIDDEDEDEEGTWIPFEATAEFTGTNLLHPSEAPEETHMAIDELIEEQGPPDPKIGADHPRARMITQGVIHKAVREEIENLEPRTVKGGILWRGPDDYDIILPDERNKKTALYGKPFADATLIEEPDEK